MHPRYKNFWVLNSRDFQCLYHCHLQVKIREKTGRARRRKDEGSGYDIEHRRVRFIGGEEEGVGGYDDGLYVRLCFNVVRSVIG